MFELSLGRVNLLAVLLIFLLSVAAFSSIGILSATFTLVGLPLSLLAFHLGVRWARITGTLSHF
jgi:hypothetical protein